MLRKIETKRFFESPDGDNYYFGYFDTPQVSMDDSKILGMKCNSIDRVPDPERGDIADVGYFDLKNNNNFIKIGTTRSFNWQQGCMLQFCGPDYNEKIIYNDFDGEKYVSKIYDIVKEETSIISEPIYAMFPCGTRALTIDFSRHFWCRRGYSYGNIVNNQKNKDIVEGDGIWLIDLLKNQSIKVIGIEEMINEQHISSMQGSTHYLEHMTINDSGEQFIFLHRWKFEEGGIHSRLYLSDTKDYKYKIINDSGRMSHYCWKDNQNVIGYGGVENRINRLRKNKSLLKSFFRFFLPIYHFFIRDFSKISKKLTGDSYININVVNGGINKIAEDLISDDGHPSFLKGENIFFTDTYARSKHNQKPKLIAHDLDSKKSHMLDELGSISELDETPVRCDLHPRVSKSGNIITIDTMDKGCRSIYAYRIKLKK